MQIRPITTQDVAAVARLRGLLWPDAPLAELTAEVQRLVEGQPRSTLPLTVFVAESPAGELIGFVEVGLRSHADGCDPARPCGFVEGWFVLPDHARQGVGRALLAQAEAWSRDQGAQELASDTWLDNTAGQRAHEALGFEVVDRCVNYRKAL